MAVDVVCTPGSAGYTESADGPAQGIRSKAGPDAGRGNGGRGALARIPASYLSEFSLFTDVNSRNHSREKSRTRVPKGGECPIALRLH